MNYISSSYIKEKWQHTGFQKYFRNTGWMFIGQSVMILSLFINIWMARHLGPENFGTISYVFAFVGIFSFVANFGLSDILIRDLVQHPEEKNKLLGTAFRLLTFGGIVAFIITNVSAFIFEDKLLIQILIVAYSTIFLWSPVNVISAYFQATVQAKQNALAQIIGTLLTSILKIFLLVTNQGVIWLILAFALDYVIGTILYIYNYTKSDLDFKQWTYDNTITKRLLSSSSLIMLSTAAGYLLFKVDQIMVKYYLGEAGVGLYAAAVKLSEIWYFIPAIICSSLFPALINAKKTNGTTYSERLRKLFLFLGGMAVIIAIPISLLAYWIIKILYGIEYIESVPILQIYIWSGVGLFLMTGINKYLMTENHLKSIFYYNLLAVITNILLNIILIPKIGLMGAAWATLISYLVGPLIVLLHAKFLQKNHGK
jgi:O-antigen/teichoic acid export membrane protein